MGRPINVTQGRGNSMMRRATLDVVVGERKAFELTTFHLLTYVEPDTAKKLNDSEGGFVKLENCPW